VAGGDDSGEVIWRVFVSHTSELRDFPAGGSYVAAVERAISACGHVVVDMAGFPAADRSAGDLCRERVRSCDVYVGVLGIRYGSLVPDMPRVSYTELEFDTATEEGLPRLVFVLDTGAAKPGISLSHLIDSESGARQEEFRRRVQGSLVTRQFSDPGTLGQLVERSLRELAARQARAAPRSTEERVLAEVTDPFARNAALAGIQHEPAQPGMPFHLSRRRLLVAAAATAVAAAAGGTTWALTGTNPGGSHPAAVPGGSHPATVYVGSGDHFVYALDAATGAVRWAYPTGNWIYSSPAVVDGTVYIGSYDHFVYALDAATGAVRWTHRTGDWVTSSPAVVDGVLYIGSKDHLVYALDAATGAVRWTHRTGAPIVSRPAVVDGVVYVGSEDHFLYALDAATGAVRWTHRTGGPIGSSAAVTGGVVYVGSDDFSVYALDATTGAVRWTHRTGGKVISSPAVAGGVVYVGSDDLSVYALDAATGAVRWTHRTGAWARSSPRIAPL
jgi:outer membrane protein assembly factor BamB